MNPYAALKIKDFRRLLLSIGTLTVAREAQIVECLKAGVGRIPAMVERMYVDVDRRLHPAAARSVLAHLIHMVEEYARHNGHADFLREGIDGVTGA